MTCAAKSSLYHEASRRESLMRTEGVKFPLWLDALKAANAWKGFARIRNFKIKITTLPNHLNRLCLIFFDFSHRDLSNGVKFFKIGEKLLLLGTAPYNSHSKISSLNQFCAKIYWPEIILKKIRFSNECCLLVILAIGLVFSAQHSF